MSDIYSAPNAPLMQAGAIDGYGSVEKALAGNYDFSVGEVLSEAWAKTDGSKWTFQVAFGIYVGVLFLVLGIFAIFGVVTGTANAAPALAIIVELVSQLANYVVITPLMTGIMILGLRRAVGTPIRAGQILNHYGKVVPLFITSLLKFMITMVGFLLLILPGIYFGVSYLFAEMLVVDKGLSPSAAMTTSRKAVGHKWFALFGLTAALFVINMLALIPLTLGLIWTIPMSVIAMGVAYRNIFGCENATISEQ
jgi:hypothetical protein